MAVALRKLRESGLPEAWRGEVEAWIEWLRVNRGLAPASVEAYASAVIRLMRWLVEAGVAELGAVEGRLVERWLRELFAQRALSAKTRSGLLAAVRVFWLWRSLEGLGPDVTVGLRGPKRSKRVPRKYSDEQMRRLFASCDLQTPAGIRDFAILVMFYTTGLRLEEMEQLSLADLSLSDRGGMVRVHGKGAKERMISFGRETVTALQAWFVEREKIPALDDPQAVWVALVPSSLGRRLGRPGLYRVVTRAKNRAGVRVEHGMAVHTLRATFATDLYDETHDIRAVQRALGHETVTTTEAYIAISRSALNTRLPSKRVREVVEGKQRVPRWLQRKLDERARTGRDAGPVR